jgi:hypothetical protein
MAHTYAAMSYRHRLEGSLELRDCGSDYGLCPDKPLDLPAFTGRCEDTNTGAPGSTDIISMRRCACSLLFTAATAREPSRADDSPAAYSASSGEFGGEPMLEIKQVFRTATVKERPGE